MSHFSSHTHSRPSHISSLSFATLTHSQSHRWPKLSLPVQALSLVGPSSVTAGLFYSLQNYIYIYIYIVFSLRCLFHMNPICRVKVRGITWHHCQVPKPSPICRAKVCFLFIFFFQNSSISILLIHTIFVPKPSPYIH